jgi:peptide/nickel transport system substrate-binding protein
MIARVLAPALVAAFLAVGAGAATPRRGGTIVLASSPISCLNPFGSCDLITAGILSQTLEGAYEPAADGIDRPYLVSGVTIGRDRVKLTYNIRPEARWNDGVPVSTADFGFTYRTYATQESSPDRELYAKIRRFRALDAKTFRIELREPFAGWKDFFYEVLPRHALAGEDITKVWRDRVDNPKTGRLIGNGPFLAGRLEIGRQLTLIRNPNYWGRHTAYLDRIIRRFNVFDPADPDLLGPLRRNEIDMAPFNLAALGTHAAEVERLPGWRVVSWPSPQDEHLVFRLGPGGHPALKNKLVRRALAYGIDRVQIARRTLPELGRRARPLDNTSFPARVSSYRPNWSVYRYDPARARRLLAQAGCRRGADGIHSCGGERLRLRFLTTAGVPRRARALELIKNQLKQAGVEVQPVYVPSPALFFTVLPGGDFDAALFNVPMVPGGSATAEAICGDAGNWAGYCTRLTMRDVQQVDRILDPAVRSRLLNAVDRKLVRDVPLLPLFQPILQFALKKTIRGIVPRGSPFNFSEHNEDWWLAR